MSSAPTGKVWLVGAGPGDPGLLTLKGARAIAQCDVLVYDYLASSAIVAMAPESCEKIYVGKQADKHVMPQDEITDLIVRLGREGKNVVRLKGGDVFVFARGGEEAAELAAAGVPFEIVPGITSGIAAPAYAGIPVTHRDHNTSFTIATGHEDPTKTASSLDFSKLANPAQTLVLLMAMGNLAGIVSKLRENGMPAEMPVAIVREGTRPTQQTLVSTLRDVVADVERARIGSPAIVIIGNVVSERERIRWFDNGPLFGKRVLVTRTRDDASEFMERLYGAGAEPLLAPTIAFGPPDDPETARNAIASIASYAWVVFSSKNGVNAAFRVLDEDGADARAFGTVRVAAVGPKTAEALAARGIIADFVPEEFGAEHIAQPIVDNSKPRDRVLLFGAQETRDGLAAKLREASRRVDVVAAYKTIAVRDGTIAVAAKDADIWTFASGSAVESFLANVPNAWMMAGEKTIACIGPSTAAVARERGLRVDVVPDAFTVEGLVAALAQPRLPA